MQAASLTQICPVCGQPLPPLAGPRIFVYNEAEAVLNLLTARLDDMSSWVPLNDALRAGATAAPGVYRLRYGGEDVYVGKAANLLRRLSRHERHLQGRVGLDLAQAQCNFVILPPPWDARASEDLLIRHYRDQGKAPWNNQGFGSNDPGRNRDESTPSPYHSAHPAISFYEIEVSAGHYTVGGLLKLIKDQLPYLLRYQSNDKGGDPGWREDLARAFDPERNYHGPADSFLTDLCQSHLVEWQLTYLPLGFILYKESKAYPHGRILYRRA